MFHTIQHGTLEYLTADALCGSVHCFSTRFGGVSEGALSSLNLGTHRGDKPENVRENYRILGAAAGFSPEETVFTRQEHTDLLLRVGEQDCGTGLEREQTAVCDGWRGTALGIAYKAVLRMQTEFGCAPEHIRAAIGPCIGRCCFEVGPEVPEAMRQALGPDAEAAIEPHGEKSHVDLKLLNRSWLEKAGVRAIDICPDCTKCQPNRFWSHRVTGGNRGSQAAIIRLKGGAPA